MVAAKADFQSKVDPLLLEVADVVNTTLDLDTTLKRELAGRREWTVYVGGDDGVPWMSVMNAIDIARGDHAKVFLISDPKRKRCEQPVPGFIPFGR